MLKKIVLVLSVCALALSAASSHRFALYQTSTLNGTQLKEGEYVLEVKDNKAIFKHGRQVTEAPVKVEQTSDKAGATTVRYVNGAISEIRLGGTFTKLVFAN